MLDIAQILREIFSPMGVVGMLICILLLFYIDAIIFPTLPELFTVVIFISQVTIPQIWFGLLILLFIAVGEIAGLTTLYLIVKKAKVPKRIQRVIQRYEKFLIYPDERMILLNRIAPVLPFLGAFVAICNWSYRKSITFTLIGGMAKYGLILAASSAFIAYLDSGTATTATLTMVIIVLILSFVVSLYRKRKVEATDENRAA